MLISLKTVNQLTDAHLFLKGAFSGVCDYETIELKYSWKSQRLTEFPYTSSSISKEGTTPTPQF